jgi:hypothetical protein
LEHVGPQGKYQSLKISLLTKTRRFRCNSQFVVNFFNSWIFWILIPVTQFSEIALLSEANITTHKTGSPFAAVTPSTVQCLSHVDAISFGTVFLSTTCHLSFGLCCTQSRQQTKCIIGAISQCH